MQGKSDILLGIDLGTTVLKAAAFDARTGRALADASVRLPVRTAGDGTREQDPAAVGRAVRTVARALQARVGPAWRRVAGVGLSAQGGSAILMDRRTGRALTAMQLWNDTRPLARLAGIAARKPAGYWYRLSWLRQPGAGLARIEWLRERHGRLFHAGNIYGGAGEYLYFKLTGVWRQDAGNALQIGCYDARRGRLDAGPLRLVGLDADFVAPMRRGHETHGLSAGGAALLNLPAGVPVAGPYIDHEAGYLGSAGVSARPLQCSLGTAWVGNYVLRSGSPPATGLNLVLPSPVGPGWGPQSRRVGIGGPWLILRVMLAGAVSFDWALAALLGRASGNSGLVASVTRDLLTRAESIFREHLLPPTGLVALPWLTRPNLFDGAAAGAGGFLGVNAHSTRADLLRAVVAGMCFEFARVFEPVRAARAVDGVVLGGGASRGGYFRALLAGLFAPLPVVTLADDELSGVRGTVHAFRPGAPPPRTSPVPRPTEKQQTEIDKQYALYRQVCGVLSRGLPDGGGVLLDERGRTKGRKR